MDAVLGMDLFTVIVLNDIIGCYFLDGSALSIPKKC